ncbi:MAG: MarR family EPS-associated transcriptional regulator [Deltaproteobacteria bacterium CG_4_8_14_3_um_filter_51_11]|nr:MAG: MarR family EPS-associated transcriptional regulator [Deltaproteobacteria bacterium CG_4_8_14_3_um_filter_51_11]PIY25966.1 MAG: MarR family EPS-associated transcriptional regulator [Deltaproteobacteria bacterium CG_4_10_14_3_um_filter_51_14]
MRILRILSTDGELTQRDLARHLGISLGKTNYCLTEIAGKALVGIKRFKNSNNKIAYAYLLTPKGLKEKAKLTKSFLSLNVREYEALKRQEHVE